VDHDVVERVPMDKVWNDVVFVGLRGPFWGIGD
jgi:hypothetical protein